MSADSMVAQTDLAVQRARPREVKKKNKKKNQGALPKGVRGQTVDLVLARE